jgi:hypothetical protein
LREPAISYYPFPFPFVGEGVPKGRMGILWSGEHYPPSLPLGGGWGQTYGDLEADVIRCREMTTDSW